MKHKNLVTEQEGKFKMAEAMDKANRDSGPMWDKVDSIEAEIDKVKAAMEEKEKGKEKASKRRAENTKAGGSDLSDLLAYRNDKDRSDKKRKKTTPSSKSSTTSSKASIPTSVRKPDDASTTSTSSTESPLNLT
jgi:hypothetical protein